MYTLPLPCCFLILFLPRKLSVRDVPHFLAAEGTGVSINLQGLMHMLCTGMTTATLHETLHRQLQSQRQLQSMQQ
eukprot:jgi/Botrbrau1/857/Bobra.0352s0050.1